MMGVAAVFVLTRSPFSEVSQRFLSLVGSAVDLVKDVRLYLFYDGVLAARKGGQVEKVLEGLITAGVRVITDGTEFKARGLAEMAKGIEVLSHPVSELVEDIMDENSRLILV